MDCFVFNEPDVVCVKMGQKWLFNRSIVQGSGIGPTLFVICIIDLKPAGSTNYVTKYADDASFWSQRNVTLILR